jgi:pimeloyl-ACP methyl ester carboxylesterase
MARELVGALRAVLGLPWLALERRRLPRGDGGPVLVLPGFATGDESTQVLRGLLRWLGHDARGWGLGRNRGDVGKYVPRVVDRLRTTAAQHRRKLALVGWSLGGVIAREAARAVPDLVRHVVTMGSPVIGGPKYTATAPKYARRGVDLDALERRIAATNAAAIPVPITAIYSRSDSIVAWRACIDDNAANHVEHVEVRTSHLGLGFSPEVLRIVARALAPR